MAKILQTHVFGVPSRDVLGRIEAADKTARIRQAGFAFEAKMQDLETQFEAKAATLRAAYLDEVAAIQAGE